ncbi:hypothetical protein ACQJBY_016613 [Aegilops geniculata]
MEMEIDSVQASGRRSAEELDEALPFVARKKMKHPEKGMGIGSVLGRQLAEELSELLEALSLAARADRENWKGVDCVRSLRPVDMEEALAVADRKKVGKPEKGKEVASWQPAGELEEALSVAVRSGLTAEEVRKFLRVAAWSNLTDYDVRCLAVERGLRDEDAVPLAENFLTMYKIVFSTLHAQLSPRLTDGGLILSYANGRRLVASSTRGRKEARMRPPSFSSRSRHRPGMPRCRGGGRSTPISPRSGQGTPALCAWPVWSAAEKGLVWRRRVRTGNRAPSHMVATTTVGGLIAEWVSSRTAGSAHSTRSPSSGGYPKARGSISRRT